MKFDIVIGNPPYNNDIYLDFVQIGYQLSSKYTCMITPAKWQAKGGEKNEAFRHGGEVKVTRTDNTGRVYTKPENWEAIVPHMSKIVIEHNCKEIFDIQETSGISYFLIDKNIHDIKLIKNKCRVNSTLDKDWEEHKDFICWTNEIIDIVNKCKGESIKDKLNYRRFEFTAEQERGHIKRNDNDIAVMQGQNIVGYLSENELFTTNNIEKYKVTSLILISMQVIFGNSTKILGSQNYNILRPNQVPKGSFPVLRYFDSEDECKSFVSYFNSKLMSFLFFVGVCGGTLTQEFYRYIPDPGAFDHIFTDEELYKKYNLTDEEINIIESVIKKRK